jgi:hypothetical protein
MATDRYYELDEDIVAEINQFIDENVVFATKLQYAFVGDTKQKNVITIKKIPDTYKLLYKREVLIIVNADLYTYVSQDEKSIELLLTEAFSGLSVNMESGAIKINRPNFITNDGVVEKYDLSEVKKAKDLEKSVREQIADSESDSASDDIDIGK